MGWLVGPLGFEPRTDGFTGDPGQQYGYRDEWSKDRIFSYTGEGQKGDMRYVSENIRSGQGWRPEMVVAVPTVPGEPVMPLTERSPAPDCNSRSFSTGLLKELRFQLTSRLISTESHCSAAPHTPPVELHAP
jgi:hypothetical protein